MMTVEVLDIDWDTSDYDDDAYDPCSPNIPDLPTSVGCLDIGADSTDSLVDICDAITEALSNEYGFCVKGFGSWRRMEEE